MASFFQSSSENTGSNPEQSNVNATGTTGTDSTSDSSSGGFGGLGNKVNEGLGGGAAGEKNEDALDKGVDLFQQHVLGQGDQSNENAMEQQKDEMISDYARSAYKSATGSDVPVADK